MTDPAVAAAFAKHKPWITKYELRGASSGDWFDAPNDPRLGLFRRCFPNARCILELGSLEGGHTIGLARQAGVERVLGIEGRKESYERAQLAKQLFAVDNISFVHANLENIRLVQFGNFDAVYCCGLLYHLPLHDADRSRIFRRTPARKRPEARTRPGDHPGSIRLIVRL